MGRADTPAAAGVYGATGVSGVAGFAGARVRVSSASRATGDSCVADVAGDSCVADVAGDSGVADVAGDSGVADVAGVYGNAGVSDVAGGVLTEGLAVRDEFLSAARVRGLIRCANLRRTRGEFDGACIGAGQRLQRCENVRGDLICWLAGPLLAAERAFMRDLEELRLNFNREAFLGLFDLEAHYAWYPPGAGYARHVDQLLGRDARVVSFIMYLNMAWRPGAGGELRVFDGDGYRDIAPAAGRLVCFLAADREHAVLPTRDDRLSITGWFRRRTRLPGR
jgi:SM-20-related protein